MPKIKDLTDWERLRKMPDSAIKYTKDAPRTKPSDLARAIYHRGIADYLRQAKAQIAIRVDADVLKWFKAQGPGYQTRMNAVLRAYRDAHLKPARR